MYARLESGVGSICFVLGERSLRLSIARMPMLCRWEATVVWYGLDEVLRLERPSHVDFRLDVL